MKITGIPNQRKEYVPKSSYGVLARPHVCKASVTKALDLIYNTQNYILRLMQHTGHTYYTYVNMRICPPDCLYVRIRMHKLSVVSVIINIHTQMILISTLKWFLLNIEILLWLLTLKDWPSITGFWGIMSRILYYVC